MSLGNILLVKIDRKTSRLAKGVTVFFAIGNSCQQVRRNDVADVRVRHVFGGLLDDSSNCKVR